jgi:hypothetical protein
MIAMNLSKLIDEGSKTNAFDSLTMISFASSGLRELPRGGAAAFGE